MFYNFVAILESIPKTVVCNATCYFLVFTVNLITSIRYCCYCSEPDLLTRQNLTNYIDIASWNLFWAYGKLLKASNSLVIRFPHASDSAVFRPILPILNSTFKCLDRRQLCVVQYLLQMWDCLALVLEIYYCRIGWWNA